MLLLQSPSTFPVEVVCAEHPTGAQPEGVDVEFTGGEGDEHRCAEEEAQRGVVLKGTVGGRQVGFGGGIGIGLGLGLWLGGGRGGGHWVWYLGDSKRDEERGLRKEGDWRQERWLL